MVPAVTTTVQSIQTANAAGSTVNLTGYQFLGVQISGTFVGQVNFEASLDGVGWCPVALIQANNSSLYEKVTSFASYGAALFITDSNHPASAFGNFRVRTSNMVSGSVTATVIQSGPVDLQ